MVVKEFVGLAQIQHEHTHKHIVPARVRTTPIIGGLEVTLVGFPGKCAENSGMEVSCALPDSLPFFIISR